MSTFVRIIRSVECESGNIGVYTITAPPPDSRVTIKWGEPPTPDDEKTVQAAIDQHMESLKVSGRGDETNPA